jgi:GT2 family glycosyltransferase
MVDVIIPIFNAFDDVQACLERVVKNSPADVNIILIDDASTDFRIRALLGDLSSAGDGRLHILFNEVNQGFVRTVNRGFAFSTNDVILLNSDTRVPPNWLERLRTCAQSRPRVGTVTPFSNNAEICSYPVFCRETLVADLELTDLEAALALADDGDYPEVPTAVGFCMYIRRELIDRIGVFDAERFGQGYGEENDFCMRATAAGFSHLLCTSTYVVHRGGRSFQTETQTLKENNLKVLLQLYPDYSDRVARFVAADPIQPYRQRVVDKLAEDGKDALGRPLGPGILLITHRYGGGVDKHVMDLVELLASKVRVEVLRPIGSDAVALDDALGNRVLFDINRWDELLEVLGNRRYAVAHLHHFHGYPSTVLNLPSALNIPFDVTLHDFSVYCPQYSLTTAQAKYCGEPDQSGCAECLRTRPHSWALPISDWRERMASLLGRARRVICPSFYLRDKIKGRFPAIDILVRPHPPRNEWRDFAPASVKVLILGGLSRAKGLQSVLDCAWDAKHRNLPVTFTLVGYPERGVPTYPKLPLRISGEYDDMELPWLIESERANCVWFPGHTPESYSYTLDMAMKSGLPIVAGYDQGALTERLAASSANYQIVDAKMSASQLNSIFLQWSQLENSALRQNSLADNEVRDEYRDWLLSVLSPSSNQEVHSVKPVSALQSNFLLSDVSHTPRVSLGSLYEQAIECGHRESRTALRQQLALIETDRRLLDSLSATAGKPWYVHIQHLTELTQALQVHSRKLTEQVQQYALEISALKLEAGSHLTSLRQQHEIIFQRDQSIASLETKYRELICSSESKLREVVESSQYKLREVLEASENKQREMTMAHEATQQSLTTESARALRELIDAHQLAQQALTMASEKKQRELMDAAADQQNRLIQHYEQSNSWRVTAPMRSTRAFLASNLKQLARTIKLINRAWHRWPVACNIAREQGLSELAKRIRSRLFPPHPPVTPIVETDQVAISQLLLPTCQTTLMAARVSIVIPVYGQHQFTFNCLHSILQHTKLEDVQIIVIDDCSPEPARDALAQVDGVHWLRNTENLGFIRSCNSAAQHAEGEYLVLLNNDTQVTKGWLEALLSVFDMREDAGLVGARLVYPDGRLQEAGGIVWRDGSAWNWGRGQDPDHPYFRYLRRVDYCSGACLALRRADWVALGGFDCDYVPAYYEDTDFAFRVRNAGKSVYYQPETVIIHYEGVTSGTDESKGVKQHQEINRSTFSERWKDVLKAHHPNGIQPWAEANRAAKKRVLIVEACMITPDQDSGSVRMLALLQTMIALGVQVSFIADNLEYRQPYVSQMQQLGVEVLYHPYVQSVHQLIEQTGDHFDVVFLCRHYIAAQYIATVRKHAPQAQIWFDTVDLHYLREERLAELQQSASLREVAAVTRRQELAVIHDSDLTFVVSDVEQTLLAEVNPECRVEILSNIHEPVADTPPFRDRNGLLFVGGFQHPPNVDAVNWFVREIWPLLEVPNVTLKIVGSKMPESMRALEQPGIEILGFVADIEPLLLSSKISIAPLRYGAGVKGKVNQAMSYGLPVVATSAGVEGMHLVHGQNVLVADTPQAFATEVRRLLSDELLWHTLADGGKLNVSRTFSRDVARATLRRVLDI